MADWQVRRPGDGGTGLTRRTGHLVAMIDERAGQAQQCLPIGWREITPPDPA
jgi:hypothetical protein